MFLDNTNTSRMNMENYFFASKPCDISQVCLKQLRANKKKTPFGKIADRRIEMCKIIFQEDYMRELTEETLDLINLAKKSI